jgi:hypothetical protein
MSAPRRWLDDPDADEALREVLRGAPASRPLDQITRRRLGARVRSTSALPVAAAGWLFVKSAGAALGVVLGTGALAVSTGVVEWLPRATPTQDAAAPKTRQTSALAKPPAPREVEPVTPLIEDEPPPLPLNPTPALPSAPATSAVSTLSAEVALLERARRELQAAPASALTTASEHVKRFPRGQLAAERTLIQIDALHRLGRDAEARALGRGLLEGASGGLYAERVRQLLGAEIGR